MVKLLDSLDVVLTGQWVFDGQSMRADEACARIEALTSEVLEKVAISRENGAWETLFRDPRDGRLWERTYPEGDLQGGGPPRLAAISVEDARNRYELDARAVGGRREP
jgi:hypothetical protein